MTAPNTVYTDGVGGAVQRDAGAWSRAEIPSAYTSNGRGHNFTSLERAGGLMDQKMCTLYVVHLLYICPDRMG